MSSRARVLTRATRTACARRVQSGSQQFRLGRECLHCGPSGSPQRTTSCCGGGCYRRAARSKTCCAAALPSSFPCTAHPLP
eukprot:scaffold63632_cov48-Phaeocystis_antarctica.AAC.1